MFREFRKLRTITYRKVDTFAYYQKNLIFLNFHSIMISKNLYDTRNNHGTFNSA